MSKFIKIFLSFLIILGFADSLFLTYEHFTMTSVGCPVTPTIDCLAVTTSEYSTILGVPLAILGMIYYTFMFFFFIKSEEKMFRSFLLFTSIVGAIFSLYLIFIQAFLIGLFCIYCLASAAISFLTIGTLWITLSEERKTLIIDLLGYGYKYVLKNILFLVDATIVHENMVDFGNRITKVNFVKSIFEALFVRKYKTLETKRMGLKFTSPLGLAAGFDYEAKLFDVTPLIGFGFETIGTVTKTFYGGNPAPQLGRLPKSQSLLVNKGFKSEGSEIVSDKLKNKRFSLPIGISIGRTNSLDLDTLDKSIKDIVKAFKVFEKKNIKNSYYELNISCPNIIHNAGISFYKPNDLEKLLKAVDKLRVKKPILVKMPIDQTDAVFNKLLSVISKHRIAGVIIGNLQTNKKHKSLIKSEVAKYKMGKYSGKPTFEDSNRLIKIAYKKYKDRFVIVGCGGVFTAEDAWIKFVNGASLVQLITGMIFEGPQLIAQINYGLDKKLRDLGYKNIQEIVGIEV